MASALDTIAHVVMPNVMKLKGASTLVGSLERGDTSPFAQVWQQTGVEHTPQAIAKEIGDWRVGVISLPKPSAMGDAYMCAFVAKKNEPTVARYFTLDYDYVLATKTEKTVLCDQEMGRMIKRGDGPAITGDFATDASAFIDAAVEYLNTVKKY